MTTPQVGVTHDIVLFVNNSIRCGLVVRPFSYRAGFAPQFIPRYSIGDMRGVDRSRWRSWIQSRFDGGAGQAYWGSSAPTARFSESLGITIGLSLTRRPYDQRASMENVEVWEDLDDSVMGDVSPAIVPVATTAHSTYMELWWSLAWPDENTTGIRWVEYQFADPVKILEMSNRPHVLTHNGALCYTAIQDTNAWVAGVMAERTSKLTGKWAGIDVWTGGGVVYDAVKYSGVIVYSKMDVTSEATWVYGSLHTAGMTAATFYQPSWSTMAHKLSVYDDKLWRSYVGQVYYLEPAVNTLDARWSDAVKVGDPNIMINQLLSFNGKLYIGKRDALWVFDGGITYLVESFEHEADNTNFSMMEEHQGYMYFNIRNRVYRISTTGLLELLQTPWTKGAVIGGASVGGELHMLVATGGTYQPSHVWTFNAESGGTRNWFKAEQLAYNTQFARPTVMKAVSGVLWLMPMQLSAAYSSASLQMPIVALNQVPESSAQRYFTNHSHLITSILDFGLPNLSKIFNAVSVDYLMQNIGDLIKVYYATVELHETYTGGAGTDDAVNIPFPPGTTDPVLDMDKAFDGNNTTHTALFRHGVGGTTVAWQTIAFGFTKQPRRIQLVVEPDYDISEGSVLRILGPGGAEMPIDYNVESWIERNGYKYYMFEIKNFEYIKTKWSKWNYTGFSNTLPYGGSYYWVELWTDTEIVDPPSGPRYTRITEVSPVIDDQVGELVWNYLGSIGGITDARRWQKTLTFPDTIKSKMIALKFEFMGAGATKPFLRRYEVEWMPEPSNLRVINAAVLAVDNIELLNREKENSAGFIAATLFSLAGAGKPYVAWVPWPINNTIRAIVSISDPGASAPDILHAAQNQVPEGEIPIRLDEV